MEATIKKIKISNYEIYLENFEFGKGKIMITDGINNYSYFWGAMGDTLEDFIIGINSDYFSNKLIDYRSFYSFNVKKTFTILRKHIKQEIIPWYKHMEFQKQMRYELNKFENYCKNNDSETFFVNYFSTFVNSLDYDLIEGYFDRKDIEDEFKSITEPWHFIMNSESDEVVKLKKLHNQLKKYLTNEKGIENLAEA
jgi:hypothetical protein